MLVDRPLGIPYLFLPTLLIHRKQSVSMFALGYCRCVSRAFESGSLGMGSFYVQKTNGTVY